METKRGCLRYGLLGCLGMVALFLLLLVITAFVAWRGIDKQQIEEGELRPALIAVPTSPVEPAAPAAPGTPDAPATPAVLQVPRKAAGRVIRSEEDIGIILLVDDRFNTSPYRNLLPGEWQPAELNGVPVRYFMTIPLNFMHREASFQDID